MIERESTITVNERMSDYCKGCESYSPKVIGDYGFSKEGGIPEKIWVSCENADFCDDLVRRVMDHVKNQ